MKPQSTRIRVQATVPPGESLVGVLPHDIFRLELAKLTPNEHVILYTANGIAVPFDGRIHDLRARTGGPTLCIGNHVSLFVRNVSDEPQAIELQLGGTTIDHDDSPQGVVAELSYKLVLGIFAQEVEPEPWPTPMPISDMIAYAADHYANAKWAAVAAFEQSVRSGSDEDARLSDIAQERRDRLERMLRYVQSLADTPPATLPEAGKASEYEVDEDQLASDLLSMRADDDALGFTSEQWEGMRTALKERNGWSDEQLDQHLSDMQDPEKRRAYHATHVGGAGVAFTDD